MTEYDKIELINNMIKNVIDLSKEVEGRSSFRLQSIDNLEDALYMNALQMQRIKRLKETR